MKQRAPWIIALLLSLAANFALAGRWRAGRPADVVAAGTGRDASSATAAASAAPIDPETWTQLDAAGEPADFIALLRAKGYPPAIVRAIVRAQLGERFADRTKALNDAIAAQPFWRGMSWVIDPKISAAQRALSREIREQMRQLLGPGFEALSDAERGTMVRRYGDLSPDKMDALQQIASDYGEMTSEIRMAARSNSGMTMLLPEDREKLALLEKEQRADIAKLLSPEELDAYDLRLGRTASNLRYQLAAFEPSEQEFLALYRLEKPLDDRYPAAEQLTPAQRRERADAQKEIAAQIAAALGPERYAEYQRKTDSMWRQNSRFVSEFGLPAPATDQLFAIQKDLSERARTVRQGNLPYEQLSAQLIALEQEATTRLKPIIGDRLLAGYRNNYGYWLRELQPPPRPAPKD